MTDIQNTSNLLGLVKKLFPFNYSVVGGGNDKAIRVLMKLLPFDVFEYKSGEELNGWTIPDEFKVINANISKDGCLIYDASKIPLGIPILSESFNGELTLDELIPHLFSVSDLNAIPYHWSMLYRPNEKLWGFCIPRKIVKSLSEGKYNITLNTMKTPSSMKVLVYTLPGDTKQTVLLNAHNCHPYQANDDISGVAVGIEIMNILSSLSSRRYTYKLMVAPELFGPMFWLDEMQLNDYSSIIGTIMLKSVGNRSNLKLQESFIGNSVLDRIAHNVFKHNYGEYDSGPFRAIYGNDETVFEAPPYRIPSISVTRWPFSEYHTDLDTPDRLSEDKLRDTVETVVQICKSLEYNKTYLLCFSGLVCLSKYGLYKTVPDVEDVGVNYFSIQGRWSQLMNGLPSCLDRNMDVLTISEKYDLPIGEVYDYLQLWADNDLVRESL